MAATRLVTLLTDFGTADGYAGIMKGIILQRAPEATVIDLSHEIPPQDVRAAALVLRSAAPYFPPHTVHVAVVDPGVGSARRALCVVTESAIFVGPDNGVLTLAAPPSLRRAVYALEDERWFLKPVSRTFHGRDIFAPVAGELAAGLNPSALGPPLQHIEELAWPQAQRHGQEIRGEVIYVDRFGNLITNVPAEALADFSLDRVWVSVGGRMIRRIAPTYSSVCRGDLVALIGSWGLLEVAVREGSAARELGLGTGAPVKVTIAHEGE